MRRKALLIGVVASLGLPAGALADDVASATSGGPGRDPVVARWNQELLHIAGTPGAQPPTIHPTRNFAIVHVAIYDAVQAITRSHEPYA
ncbi:MAG: haloperoxidase, partial [Actinomycetota bacterium]|nr:haloperoxidase [Actinomycetota bacterium]